MIIDLSDSPLRNSDNIYDVPIMKDKGHLLKESVSRVEDGRYMSSVSSWQPYYLNSLRREAISPTAVENNQTCCLSLHDIISSTKDDITNVVILTFDVDIEWLLETVPILITKPLLVLHNGLKKTDTVQLENVVLSPVDMGIERYGTHHNKIIFVFYERGLRVAITTANFTEVDWTLKIQGTYVQDFPRKTSSRSSSEFECSLLSHCERITPMGSSALQVWKKTQQQIKQYEFESAEVILISSVPGRHNGPGRNKWGQWKLREEIMMSKSEGGIQDCDQRLLMQFSSIGALKKDEAFIEELATSLGTIDPNALQTSSHIGKKQKTSKNTASQQIVESHISKQRVELVWPTVDAVRGSIQGWAAGFSIPCESKNMFETIGGCDVKSGLSSRLHRYDSFCSGRGLFTPHMKCYFSYKLMPMSGEEGRDSGSGDHDNASCQYSSSDKNKNSSRGNSSSSSSSSGSKSSSHNRGSTDEDSVSIELEWFLLTSANLSQAAWGVAEKSGTQLYVKSFEMGVLFLPERVRTTRRVFSCTPSHPILGYGSDLSKDHTGSLYSNNNRSSTSCSASSSYSSSCGSGESNFYSHSESLQSSKRQLPSSSSSDGLSKRSVFTAADNHRTSTDQLTGRRRRGTQCESECVVYFPIPFKVPPDPYDFGPNPTQDSSYGGPENGVRDVPWVWDRTYGNLRDRYNRTMSEYRGH